MKTKFIFEDMIDKRKLIIKHDKKIKITREIRSDPFGWFDEYDNPVKESKFIVIKIPKEKAIDIKKLTKKIKSSAASPAGLGFQFFDFDRHYELLFYDSITLLWIIHHLEREGLFKITERVVPEYKDSEGDLFSFYINARNIGQTSYNAIFMLLQYLILKFKRTPK